MGRKPRIPKVSMDVEAILLAVMQMETLPMREAFVDALCLGASKDKIFQHLKRLYPVIKDVKLSKGEADFEITMVFPY